MIRKPVICVVGNLVGHNPGYGTTQGQILAHHLRVDGSVVVTCSSVKNRLLRLVDIFTTILRNRNTLDITIVEVYSGLSFVIADVVGCLGKWLKIRLVGVLHGGNLPQFSKKFPRWSNRVLRRFDVLVAPSAFLERDLEISVLRPRIIPNILDLTSYPHRLRSNLGPALLWMRAFHSIYNPAMAIQVLAEVRRTHRDATLVMAGVDKGLQEDMLRLAKEMGLSDAVRFPGFLDHAAKIREFSNADIFLNTTTVDNMPVAVVEACAMGLCVVATDVGGLRDLIVDRENGILVQDRSVGEMAAAVNELLGNSGLASKISADARLLAERSAWTNVQPAWDALFEELISNGKEKDIAGKMLEISSG